MRMTQGVLILACVSVFLLINTFWSISQLGLPFAAVCDDHIEHIDPIEHITPSKSSTTPFQRDYYDVCVVGAGLSGAVLAEQYASQLGLTTLIMEKRSHIGGNCYDYVDQETGILVNQYGAHLFHTNSFRVWQYVQQFSDWLPYEHQVLGRIGNQTVPIPVNIDTVNQLLNLDIQNSSQMDQWLRKEQVHYDHKPRNSEEMALSRVGTRLYEAIFKPYTYKQWAKWPHQLGPEVTARIPVRNNFDNRYFDDVFQALPARGYTRWFKQLFDTHKDLIEVHTNVDYFKVRHQLHCGHTFFTGPIDAYFAHLGWPTLEYRSLDFERKVVKDIGYNKTFLPASVVNYPSADYNFTRIVEYKHYLGQRTKSNHTIMFLERSKDGGEPYYPVPNQANQDLFLKYQKMADQEPNVTFAGRLANYKYFNMDQSILNALELFDQHAPNVLIPQYYHWTSGGPEAMNQLAVAFHSWMPTRTWVEVHGAENITYHDRWYPSLHDMRRKVWEDLRPGDIYIMPEGNCPGGLVQKGIRVFIWWLGSLPQEVVDQGLKDGCEFIAHNYWLGQKAFEGVQVPHSHVLVPYMNVKKYFPDPVSSEHRSDDNLILINGHDNQAVPEIQAIQAYCDGHDANRNSTKCKVQVIAGFTNEQLKVLYRQAKIVVAMCMRGSERSPIEAVLGGAVLVTNDCQSASDTRDFPVPKENLVDARTNPAADVVARILGDFEHAQERMAGMRQVYKNLGPRSLERQTKQFMHALNKVKKANEFSYHPLG